ncbi:hypothetical protein [Vogesella urethralis]|uniref:hypothetical protein n=1 Tax=Vogesella urethralis TaxID=2592656 RepID=UPI001F0FAF73|nr:hypothetical protein [Vogesella urethralis]MEC5207561.1 hypothetical protein [Vogesella perlucida]
MWHAHSLQRQQHQRQEKVDKAEDTHAEVISHQKLVEQLFPERLVMAVLALMVFMLAMLMAMTTVRLWCWRCMERLGVLGWASVPNRALDYLVQLTAV